MSNPPQPPRQKVFSTQQGSYKNADIGKRVLLDDAYLVENNKSMQMESIFIKTIQNAENAAMEIVEHARQEAQLILDAAKEQATRIVTEEGENLRDAIVQEAYKEGYQAGLEKGFGQIAEELSEKILMADTIVQKSFEAQASLIEQHRNQLLSVIETVVKLVIPYEIQSSPAQLGGLIDKAAQNIHSTGQARIRLHPETLRALQDFSPEVMKALQDVQKMTFIADLNCQPLEMILETAESSALISPDMQAEVYLKHVRKNLQFEEGDPDLIEAAQTIARLQTEDPNAPADLPAFASSGSPRRAGEEETAAWVEPSEDIAPEDVDIDALDFGDDEEETPVNRSGQTPNDEVLLKFLEKSDKGID